MVKVYFLEKFLNIRFIIQYPFKKYKFQRGQKEVFTTILIALIPLFPGLDGLE